MYSCPPRLLARSTVFLSLMLVAGSILLPSAPAHGQLNAVAQAMEPEFFTRDLLIFIEGLDLDDTQSVIAEAIFDDYEQQFDQGKLQMEMEIEGLTEELKSMRGTADQDKILELVVSPIQAWMIRREELNERLIENVRIILVPEQQYLWTEFNRRLYREKKLDDGRFSGERTDLFVIVRDTGIVRGPEALEAALLNYDTELDQVLHARQRLLEGNQKDLLNALQNRSTDPNFDMDTKKKIIDLRVQVRNVNDRYRGDIAATLSGEQAVAFQEEALRRSYPKIFRGTNAERVFDDALAVYNPASESEKADQATYDAIWSLYAEFLTKLSALNDEIYITTRESEPQLELARLENSLRRTRGEEILRPTDPVKALQQKKRELEREYIDKLRAMLGDEQFVELNGARRYVPPAEFNRNEQIPGDKGERLLQLERPNPKFEKPDKRPDAPAKGMKGGSGLGRGTGASRDE
ncbi:MAG: hypothetical protein P8M22_04545 [Phycisphaerales bacterium]|nr:hypothetical protein [Phycisphaerales bacterium]